MVSAQKMKVKESWMKKSEEMMQSPKEDSQIYLNFMADGWSPKYFMFSSSTFSVLHVCFGFSG